MAKLTEKQKRFADYYIETGNAMASARRAGYKQPQVQGFENLEKPRISEYIKKRLSELEKSRLMSIEEALLLSKSIAKGELQTFVYRELDPTTDEVLVEEKKQYSPKVEERQKSIEHILKVKGAFDRDKNDKLLEQQLRKLTADADLAEIKANTIKGISDDGSLITIVDEWLDDE